MNAPAKSPHSQSPSSTPVPAGSAQARADLLGLIAELAVVRGEVTLSSGALANYYLDLRRVTLCQRSAGLVGDVMLNLFAEHGLADQVESVGGLTMGADPVATAIMHRALVRNRPLDSFVVRKQAKDYGMGRQVEGPDVAGRKVIALEDTSTTGGSVLTAVEALRAVGADVIAVAVVMDRDTGARERVEAQGLPYLAALSTRDLGLD